MSKRILFIAVVVLAAGASLGYSTGFPPSIAMQNTQVSAQLMEPETGLSPNMRIQQAFEALAGKSE